MQYLSRGLRNASQGAFSSTSSGPARRLLHATRVRHAITSFAMPAMSPTMTEGGIASWKKKKGESFSAGDVLLEIETDKATIDVESQEDGILGLIIAEDGSKNVPVGKVIALLAEEGDDISDLKAPADDQTSSPPTQSKDSEPPTSSSEQEKDSSHQVSAVQSHDMQIKSSKPIFPSVHRLLLENGVSDANKIKGTGVRGMLTKGDVLAFLGQITSPFGTYKATKPPFPDSAPTKKPEQILLDGPTTRKLILSGLVQSSAGPRVPLDPPADFDTIISDYLPRKSTFVPPILPIPIERPSKRPVEYFEGLI